MTTDNKTGKSIFMVFLSILLVIGCVSSITLIILGFVKSGDSEKNETAKMDHTVPRNLPPIDGCNTPAVLSIVWLIRHNPDTTKTDGYAVIVDDWAVWVANGKDDVKIAPASNEISDQFLQMTPECKDVLWDTSQAWLQYNMQQSIQKKLTQIK